MFGMLWLSAQHHSFSKGILEDFIVGEVAEWSNAHAWRACGSKGLQGSNPCLSAIFSNEEKMADTKASVKWHDECHSECSARLKVKH